MPALDTVVDTRRVSDDDGRAMVALRLGDGLDALVVVSAHGNLRYIYIAIAHRDSSQIFLLGHFTSCCKLRNRTGRSGFGRLTAGVGVNLGIEYQDVYILAGSDNMVQAAEADIISPAVAAENPDRFLVEEIFVLENFLAVRAVRSATPGL